MSVLPGLGVLVAVLGQMFQRRQQREALEHQLEMPPDAVPLQDVGGRQVRGREGGEDDYLAGEIKGPRLQFPACLMGKDRRVIGLDKSEPRDDREFRVPDSGGVVQFG